jgi:hypothetical protein
MCQGLQRDFNKTINIWSNHHMLKGHEDWYSQPILNHISMNQHLILVVNYIYLIISKWQVLGCSTNKFCGLKNNVMRVLNHIPTRGVYSMHFGVLFKIQRIKQILVNLIFKLSCVMVSTHTTIIVYTQKHKNITILFKNA